jgi:predicted nucleic acid-binding protein
MLSVTIFLTTPASTFPQATNRPFRIANRSDAAAAHHAADIRAILQRQGRTIGAYDILIAGHARSRALIVVTGDRGEFDRMAGLQQCEDQG